MKWKIYTCACIFYFVFENSIKGCIPNCINLKFIRIVLYLKVHNVDLDGHRVHPNPSGFTRVKKWLNSHFFTLVNPDQINRVRPVHIGRPIDLKKSKEISIWSYLFFSKSAIWDTHWIIILPQLTKNISYIYNCGIVLSYEQGIRKTRKTNNDEIFNRTGLDCNIT